MCNVIILNFVKINFNAITARASLLMIDYNEIVTTVTINYLLLNSFLCSPLPRFNAYVKLQCCYYFIASPGKFEISIETWRHHTHPLVCIAHNNRPSILYKFIRINTFYWTRNTSSIISHKNLLFAIYINLNYANFHCAHKAVNQNISLKKSNQILCNIV